VYFRSNLDGILKSDQSANRLLATFRSIGLQTPKKNSGDIDVAIMAEILEQHLKRSFWKTS